MTMTFACKELSVNIEEVADQIIEKLFSMWDGTKAARIALKDANEKRPGRLGPGEREECHT